MAPPPAAAAAPAAGVRRQARVIPVAAVREPGLAAVDGVWLPPAGEVPVRAVGAFDYDPRLRQAVVTAQLEMDIRVAPVFGDVGAFPQGPAATAAAGPGAILDPRRQLRLSADINTTLSAEAAAVMAVSRSGIVAAERIEATVTASDSPVGFIAKAEAQLYEGPYLLAESASIVLSSW